MFQYYIVKKFWGPLLKSLLTPKVLWVAYAKTAKNALLSKNQSEILFGHFIEIITIKCESRPHEVYVKKKFRWWMSTISYIITLEIDCFLFFCPALYCTSHSELYKSILFSSTACNALDYVTPCVKTPLCQISNPKDPPNLYKKNQNHEVVAKIQIHRITLKIK
jgi:hypothetical protein